MVKTAIKRMGVAGLAAAIVFAEIGIADVSQAAAITPTEAPVTVAPFPNQWKYYGQVKRFIEDEHYSLSAEPQRFSDSDWSLALASEEVGFQPFVLRYNSEKVNAENLTLTANAPQFEIRAYKAPVEVEPDTEYHSVTEYTVQAPANYQISAGKDSQGNWNWQAGLEVGGLREGRNNINYYLRSQENNDTKNAIDQTPKTTTILVDTTAPALTSLQVSDIEATAAVGTVVGNESGRFYYIVLPVSGAVQDGVTADMIRETVVTGRGMGGYGRVDGTRNGTEIKLNGLAAETEYIIYAFMEDRAGNRSSVMVSTPFTTEKTPVSGTVDIVGELVLDSTLMAVSHIDSVDTGMLSYQWYRIRLDEDGAQLNADEDESGPEEELELDEEDGSEEDSEEEGEEEEDDEVEIQAVGQETGKTTIDDAELIPGATDAAYKVTREDIGYRLIACVRTENYSDYMTGITGSFVPKLMPTYTVPTVAKVAYSPAKTLSAIKLPAQWSWVDGSAVPDYGNGGYRARFVPENPSVYKSVVVRVKVPMSRRTLKKSMIKMASAKAYAGKAIQNNFSVQDQGKTLTAKKDFTVAYKNNKNPGKATVTFTGTGNYTGTVKMSYTIKKKSISSVTCTYEKTQTYNGKKRTADLDLKNGTVNLKVNRDYKLSYSKNKAIGRASVTIKGIGNYKGTRKVYFSIVPSKPSIKKVKRESGAFRLTLGAKQAVTGYQVYISSASSFAKNSTQVYTTTGSSFGLDNLAKGAVYYVRVKAYSSVKGKKYVSAYSKTEKIKIK